MLLIEASNIRDGGAKVLLFQLIAALDVSGKDYVFINNLKELSDHPNRIDYSPRYFHFHLNSIVNEHNVSKVLCFGNYPPLFKIRDKIVYTYFHRPYLYKDNFLASHGLKKRLLYRLKKTYLRILLKNTSFYIFQSKLIQDGFNSYYNWSYSRSLIYPFFDVENISTMRSKSRLNVLDAFLYVSNDTPHKNHIRLLQAWEILSHYNRFPRLYLTIPVHSVLIEEIDRLKAMGCDIINLGWISHTKALDYTARCYYNIFPSLAETLGLGLVEAALLDSVVLASRADFVDEVIEASLYFNPEDVSSIVNSVCIAIDENLPKAKPKINSKIEELIQELTT